jgi:DNA-binding CsgD family transcriptional regulator
MPTGERCLVLQVVVTDPAMQAEVEGCLRAGGYAVLGDTGLPNRAVLGTVTAPVAITRREREVLQALVAHDGSKQIALALGVTPKVVDDHVQRLMDKLQVRSRHRLLLKAFTLRLL